MPKIDNFHAPGYEWLSNFYRVEVKYRRMRYSTVEHAYQAAKTLVFAERELIRKAPEPKIAKRSL